MTTLLIYVSVWFTAGYLIAHLAVQYTDVPFSPIQAALFSLLVGLSGLAIVTSTERGRRLFYEGAAPDEDGDPIIGCLWMITGYLAGAAILGWVIHLIF